MNGGFFLETIKTVFLLLQRFGWAEYSYDRWHPVPFSSSFSCDRLLLVLVPDCAFLFVTSHWEITWRCMSLFIEIALNGFGHGQ